MGGYMIKYDTVGIGSEGISCLQFVLKIKFFVYFWIFKHQCACMRNIITTDVKYMYLLVKKIK